MSKTTPNPLAARRLAACLAFASLASPAWAETVNEASRAYAIPAEPLSDALTEFADQSNLKLVFSAELAHGLKSKPLTGKLTARQGLQKLLEGSGLDYRFVGPNTAIIEKAPKAEAARPLKVGGAGADAPVLPTVTVTGKTAPSLDPYNEDYVIPDATAGTKTDTPVMETPLNVQVVSKQVMKDQQVIQLGQALKNVSGVTTGADPASFGSGGPEQAITLRGFTSGTYFRNGFRLQQGVATRAMANVESVEVLKGPAAVLYGLVEPGGMVNVVTKQPLATPYYAMQQQFGSYDLYRTTIDATGPLAQDDSVLYRMNLSYENSGSFREFVQNQKWFVAPVVRWNISPRTQLTFEFEYNHDNLGQDSQFVPLFNGSFIGIPRSRNYGEPATTTIENYFGGFNWSHQFNDDWLIKHRFSVSQQSSSAFSMLPFTPAYDPTGVGLQIDRSLYKYNSQKNTYSTNIDLVGHFDTAGIKHTLLFGGDYYNLYSPYNALSNNFAYDTLIDIFNPVHCTVKFCGMALDPTTYASNTQTIDQYGLYLQDQIKLPYDIHFTGGVRYQYLHQNGEFQSYGNAAVPNPALTNDKVTPRFGLLWQPKSWLSLYSNYAENFGPNQGKIFVNDSTYKAAPPTSAQQWEIGAKTELFNGRLRATLAYYELTKQNVATADPNPAHGCCILVTGEVRSRGPELDIQGEILPGWNVIATYANLDVTVTKSNDAYPAVGSRYYGVPRNLGSLWNTYELQKEAVRGLKFGGGVTLRDAQLAYNPANPNFSVPGYVTVDLLAGYAMKVGKAKITAQLNVNNLLDKHYITYANVTGFPSAAGFDGGYVNFGAPRSFLGSIRVDY